MELTFRWLKAVNGMTNNDNNQNFNNFIDILLGLIHKQAAKVQEKFSTIKQMSSRQEILSLHPNSKLDHAREKTR